MNDKQHFITSGTMDAILQLVDASCRPALKDREFVRGLFLITDVAICDAVEKERRRDLEPVRNPDAQ